MARKNRLPVANEVQAKPDKDYEARERKYQAEEGLRTLQRADEIKRDKALMSNIKALAKKQMNVCK